MPLEGPPRVSTPADPLVFIGFLLIFGSIASLICLGVLPIFYSPPSVVNLVAISVGGAGVPMLVVGFIWEGRTINKRNLELAAQKAAEKEAAASAPEPVFPASPPAPVPEPEPEPRPLVRVSEKYLKRIGF